MTDRITKVLQKMTPKERRAVLEVLEHIRAGRVATLDLKKLQGLDDIYRVRKGSFRIIFRMNTQETIRILAIERRTDITYNEL